MEFTGLTQADVSIDDVDELISDLNLRVAALQQGPVPNTNATTIGVETVPSTTDEVNTLHRANTGISHPGSGKRGENADDIGDPPLPEFLADHNVADVLRRANSLHAQRHGNLAVFFPRFDPHTGGLQTDGNFPFGGNGERLSNLA
jgi:hypothetical protein